MDLPTLAWLRSPTGSTLLAELATRDLTAAHVLPLISALRLRYPPALARAAVELALLRQHAREKFPAAERLFFLREALEQASSAVVAAQRATRFTSFDSVADLCCGLGGDALALAQAGVPVIAVDRDPLRLALAQANAEALGLAHMIRFVERDLLTAAPPAAAALFCDPGRRAGGKRRFAAEEYEPPVSHVLAWRTHTPAFALKLAPGIEYGPLMTAGEWEFVSLDGELKEARLWGGPLASTCRRATLLHTDATPPTTFATPNPTSPPAPLSTPAAYLYEPDPAIIRAGLVSDLALAIGAAQFDAQIAYLTSAALIVTPFARAWPIFEWFPFGLKTLRARLRAYDAGEVTVKKRGSPLDCDRLARELRGKGRQALTVVLTQVAAQPAVLICGKIEQ